MLDVLKLRGDLLGQSNSNLRLQISFLPKRIFSNFFFSKQLRYYKNELISTNLELASSRDENKKLKSEIFELQQRNTVHCTNYYNNSNFYSNKYNSNGNGCGTGNVNGQSENRSRLNVAQEVAAAYNNPIDLNQPQHWRNPQDEYPLHRGTDRFTSRRTDYRSSSYATENDETPALQLQCPICKGDFSGRARLATHVVNCKGTSM